MNCRDAITDLLQNHVDQIALAERLESLEEDAFRIRELLLPMVAPGEALRVIVWVTRPVCVTLFREGELLGVTFSDLLTLDDFPLSGPVADTSDRDC
jgi:hypothetical protein